MDNQAVEHEKLESQIAEYEKQIFDLKQLIEISKSLNSTLDFHALIESILYTCMGQMQVMKAGLFTRRDIYEPDLTLHRSHIGFELDQELNYTIPGNHPLIAYLTANFGSYTYEEITEAVGDLSDIPGFQDMRPTLIIPLRAKTVVNGIIVLADRIGSQEFSTAEREYLLNIAILAGIAVHNAFLYEITTTDMMTRLKLRHYFQSALLEAKAEATVHNQPLSLIMCDIDKFKPLNDTYGHLCGDQMLKAVANTILNSIRQTDIAARYGGEEFVIMLPDTDPETARCIAERIRRNTEAIELPHEGTTIKTTLSLGVAYLSQDRDTTTKMLVERADKALYMSKRSGRNQVSLAV
ncbi:diguanylate cyclase DgcA [Spirochaeta africana]|uniref:diguanylate cyclase n=1 Tax=Spirochaeta africana (strain ATCC 700263 / DSM 8902 / Z-7692) TaxID=889378 RepID=H9UHD6_SPIAZ|nr:diguanylate cyclase DgcA [Spirochaeta africana]AFG36929.1 diguanylate cyclase (GGDEF) domain-containing protein [Spirochaeta africana DSM 8902]